MTNWIEKELNQQSQQSSDRQLLADSSRNFWLSVVNTIQSDSEIVNSKYLSQIDDNLITTNPDSNSLPHIGNLLKISKTIFPAYYIDVVFDAEKQTIFIETQCRKQIGANLRSSRRTLKLSLDEGKNIILSERNQVFTQEELSQSILTPLLLS